jgi:uncharacterized protein (TIGR03032 family)
MHDQVFLSYSSPDRELVVRLAGALERSGLSVWWDAKLADGIPFDRQIKDALAGSSCIVALISWQALNSKWVRWELAQAPACGLHVVPVLVGEITAEDLPGAVAGFAAFPWREPIDPLAMEIAGRVRAHGSAIHHAGSCRPEAFEQISSAAVKLIRRSAGRMYGDSSPLAYTCSDGLASFLARHRLAIALTSYQSDALYVVQSRPSGQIAVGMANFPGAIALGLSRGTLCISTQDSLVALARMPGKNANEINYLPHTSGFTGALDIHDMRLNARGEPIFVNTRYNCLAALATRANFRVIWKPPFLDSVIDGDACHLNGLAMVNDRPSYCTLVAPAKSVDGWRHEPLGSGLVISVETNRVACAGLSFPHNPRHYAGKLWLLNSAEGEFGFVEFGGDSDGRFIAIAAVPGFARGLAFHEQYAFVGLSKARNIHSGNLPVFQRAKASAEQRGCGFQVIDAINGSSLDWFRVLSASPAEISALEVIPEALAVQVYPPESEMAAEFISWQE